MERTEKIKYLKEHIYKMIKDLKRMEYGCEVICRGYETDSIKILPNITGRVCSIKGTVVFPAKAWEGEEWSYQFVDAFLEKDFVESQPENFEVVGQPITLDHVMIALTNKFQFSAVMPAMSFAGGFYDNGELKCQWRFEGDLREQTGDMIDYLYNELLVK